MVASENYFQRMVEAKINQNPGMLSPGVLSLSILVADNAFGARAGHNYPIAPITAPSP